MILTNLEIIVAMGNEQGSLASRMGLTAIALTTQNIEIKELTILLDSFKEYSAANNTEWVPKAELEAALKKVENFSVSDQDIFLKLFTLFDVNGDNTVNFKDYTAGIIGSITSNAVGVKLLAAMNVYEDAEQAPGACSRGELKRMLSSVNNIASYFGDAAITGEEIENCTLEAFKEVPVVKTKAKGSYISSEAAIGFVETHESLQKFLRGEGTIRYGLAETYPPIEEDGGKKKKK